MKSVLIIGLGRFGRHIAQKLNQMDHQVMAVDNDEDRIHIVLPYVTNAQIGDATNEEFLSSLGIRNFDVCIVAIGDNFQSSLEIASMLKELGAKEVIARASTGIQEKFLLRNGADEVVYPEKQLAFWTAIRCTSNHILDYTPLDHDYAMAELDVPPHWIGKTVQDLDTRKKFGINILGVKKNGKLDITITPHLVMEAGWTVVVLGAGKDIQKCFRL